MDFNELKKAGFGDDAINTYSSSHPEIPDHSKPTHLSVREFVDSLKELSLDDQQKQNLIDEFLVLRGIVKLCEKDLFSEAIDLALLHFGRPDAKQDQGCTKGYKEIKS